MDSVANFISISSKFKEIFWKWLTCYLDYKQNWKVNILTKLFKILVEEIIIIIINLLVNLVIKM